MDCFLCTVRPGSLVLVAVLLLSCMHRTEPTHQYSAELARFYFEYHFKCSYLKYPALLQQSSDFIKNSVEVILCKNERISLEKVRSHANLTCKCLPDLILASLIHHEDQ